MESFFSSLKNELVRHRQFRDHAEARQAIVEHIEQFFNRQRLHQALGYQSPEEFQTRWHEMGPPQPDPTFDPEIGCSKRSANKAAGEARAGGVPSGVR